MRKIKGRPRFYIFLKKLLWDFRGKKTFALYGKSGTGKSHQAHKVREKEGINLMIDDGLLIKNGTILAGRSAKSTTLLMEAMRITLFQYDEHREEVKKAFKAQHGKKVLILGTSKQMIYKICQALSIPYPDENNIYRIEDISSESEIELARRNRKLGKHVIPAKIDEVKGKYPEIVKGEISFKMSKKLFAFVKQVKTSNKTIVVPNSLAIRMEALDEKEKLEYLIKLYFKEKTRGFRVKTIKIHENKDTMYHISYGVKVDLSLIHGEIISKSLVENKKEITADVLKHGLALNYLELKITNVIVE